MKKINNSQRRVSVASWRLRANTGSHCPANGFWRPEDRSAEPVFVFEGSIMPAGRAGAIAWYLDDAVFGPPAYPLPGSGQARAAGKK
jgi:hypothetical protein